MFVMDRIWSSAILLMLSILLQSLSVVCIKYASMRSGAATIVLLGLASTSLVARAATWQRVLARLELSRAYPFTSLVQVIILLSAVFLFGEAIAPHHVVGLAVMLIGLIVLTRKA
jgi:multidrug transporter EmrE-like cation transporter